MPADKLTVLVAGATGYVGQRLVDELVARERYAVRALVRQPGRLAAARKGLCEEVVGDVLDAASLKPACHGCDAVFSCIGGRCTPGVCQQTACGPANAIFAACNGSLSTKTCMTYRGCRQSSNMECTLHEALQPGMMLPPVIPLQPVIPPLCTPQHVCGGQHPGRLPVDSEG